MGEYGERSILGLRIGIFHITAPRHADFQRAESRSQITGRIIPRATLEHTLATVPQSVKILAPLSDFFVELHNTPNAPDIKLVTEGMTWDSFRKVWDQTCSSSRHDDWPQNTYWSQKTNFIRSADWKRIEESTKRELNATKEMSFFCRSIVFTKYVMKIPTSLLLPTYLISVPIDLFNIKLFPSSKLRLKDHLLTF